MLEQADKADVVVKASGVGVFDDALIAGIVAHARPGALKVFWDVDAPATLAAITPDPACPLRQALPHLDMVLTYGGGPPVIAAYTGARRPRLHAGLQRARPGDASSRCHRSRGSPPILASWQTGCRIARHGSEAFFLQPRGAASRADVPAGRAGMGRQSPCQPNVRRIGHTPTADHNAFNCSPLSVLNVARDSMAAVGFSPATRVFEAAGAGACLITDAWDGLDQFLTPNEEVLVARDGADVAAHIAALTPERARSIGAAALRRVLSGHTYAMRAVIVDRLLRGA